jgi:hypothetical protein
MPNRRRVLWIGKGDPSMVVVGSIAKDPAETYPVQISFLSWMDTDTIDSVVVTAVDADSGDAADDVVGAATGSDQTVTLQVKAGEDGHRYLYSIEVTTDAGNVWVAKVEMRVGG